MKTRVLQLISSGGLYGAERVLLELALYLHERDWDSRVAVFQHGDAQVALEVEARRLGLPTLALPCHGALDAGFAPRLAALARSEGLHVIHAHGYKADIYLARAKLPPSTLRVSTCHNWLTGGPRLALYRWLDKRALRRFDQVAVVSQAIQDEVRAAGVARERIHLIENGLAFERPDAATIARVRAELAPGGEPLILQIGRLSPEKGNALLLEAFAAMLRGGDGRAVEARLVLAGDGPLEAELRAQAERLGIAGRVVFTGFRSDVPALLCAADAFVISSLYEGLPTVLIEAMAARVPIIATRVGMIPRVLQEGRAGALINIGDAAALTQELTRVLTSPERAEIHAAAAHKIFEARHSRAAMGRRYEELYLRRPAHSE